MRHLVNKVAIAITVAFASATLHAQTPSVVYGRTTIQLNADTFLGASVTYLGGNPFQNNAITFEATGGAFALATGAGEVEHKGGILVNASGTILRIQDFTLDTTNPAASVMTALFILNGHVLGRAAMFNVQGAPGTTVPFTLTSGTLQLNDLSLTLAPGGVAFLNQAFGAGSIKPGISVGTASSYIVFTATKQMP